MSKVITALILLASIAVTSAQSFYTAVIEVTNVTQTGNALTNNGVARIFTNAQSATTILTNLSSAAAASTNIWAQISLNRYVRQNVTPKTNATSVTLYSASPILIGILGNWGYVTYFTNAGVDGYSPRLPFSTLPLADSTNQATDITTGLKYSTHLAETNSQWLGNFLSLGVPFGGGIQQVVAPKNFYSISGTNGGLTNGVIEGARGTNLVGLHGTVNRLTNGIYESPILRNPAATNFTNYGLALSSPGLGTSSEEFGAGAVAGTNFATALGFSADALGIRSTALGSSANASADDSTAMGSAASAEAANSVAIGVNPQVTGTNGIGIGKDVVVGHENSVAIGTAAASTDTNQVSIGNATGTVLIAGRLTISGTQSNTTHTGTNQWNGDIAFINRPVTSLANGNNAGVVLGTNVTVHLSGASGAHTNCGFAATRADDFKMLRFANPGGMCVIANESGVEPVPQNRMVTGTGGELVSTNQPAWLWLKRNGTTERWEVQHFR